MFSVNQNFELNYVRELWNTRFGERPANKHEHVGLYAFKHVLLERNWGEDYRELNRAIQRPNKDLRHALEGYERTPLTKEILEDEELDSAMIHAMSCRTRIINWVTPRLTKEAHVKFRENLELR